MDQTWSPPPSKVKSLKKPPPEPVPKKSKKDFKIAEEYSNATKDVINFILFVPTIIHNILTHKFIV